MTIDAHRHFWRYNDREFGWIDDDALRRDFLPRSIAGERVIAVEARQSAEETRWLLSLAGEHDFIAGVVGWADLRDPAALDAQIDEFSASGRLVGLRHVVQDEPDDGFILRDDFNAGVDRAGRAGLAYDILVFARHLPNTVRFADRHPSQPLVLDHCGKPRIGAEFDREWADGVRELARRRNVWCKVSGLVTEIAGSGPYSLDATWPYVETVLEAFGPERVMFGSDWPVMTARTDYAAWTEFLSSRLSETERELVFGRNAATFYLKQGGGPQC